jgi:hypothetical protein
MLAVAIVTVGAVEVVEVEVVRLVEVEVVVVEVVWVVEVVDGGTLWLELGLVEKVEVEVEPAPQSESNLWTYP